MGNTWWYLKLSLLCKVIPSFCCPSSSPAGSNANLHPQSALLLHGKYLLLLIYINFFVERGVIHVNKLPFCLFLPSLPVQVDCAVVSCFYLMTLIYGGSCRAEFTSSGIMNSSRLAITFLWGFYSLDNILKPYFLPSLLLLISCPWIPPLSLPLFTWVAFSLEMFNTALIPWFPKVHESSFTNP